MTDFKEGGSSERSIGETRPTYSGKVLVGNWFEERRSYHRAIQPWSSLYDKDFTAKKNPHDNEDFWHNRYKGGGIPIERLIGQGDSDDFIKNQVTVYDLAYHHRLKKPLGKTYGIQTQTGHRVDKEADWDDEKKENPYKTTYELCYKKHPIDSFEKGHKRAYDCDQYVKVPGQKDKCVIYKRVPLQILPVEHEQTQCDKQELK